MAWNILTECRCRGTEWKNHAVHQSTVVHSVFILCPVIMMHCRYSCLWNWPVVREVFTPGQEHLAQLQHLPMFQSAFIVHEIRSFFWSIIIIKKCQCQSGDSCFLTSVSQPLLSHAAAEGKRCRAPSFVGGLLRDFWCQAKGEKTDSRFSLRRAPSPWTHLRFVWERGTGGILSGHQELPKARHVNRHWSSNVSGCNGPLCKRQSSMAGARVWKLGVGLLVYQWPAGRQARWSSQPHGCHSKQTGWFHCESTAAGNPLRTDWFKACSQPCKTIY